MTTTTTEPVVIDEAFSIVQQLKSSIDVGAITIAGWVVISEALGYKTDWAYKCWLKTTNVNLKQLSIENWIDIATLLGRKENWALSQYMQFKNGQPQAND